MNILAVDFGTKNIGLAWCDTAIGAVLPFGIIKIKSGQSAVKQAAPELAGLIRDERINLVVVGWPVGLQGEENQNTRRIKELVFSLQKLVGDVPVELFDERFTSQQADRSDKGVTRDEKSAMIILEDYLGRHSSGARKA